MTDLHDRFRIAQQIPAPDLWVDIQARLTVSDSADKRRLRAVGSPTNRRGSLHKWLTIAAAFAIAVPAIALSVRAFREAEPSVSQNRGSEHALSVTEYPVPSEYGPDAIAAGSDGGAWFTLPWDDSIGRITSTGSVVTFELPGSHLSPNAITPGSRDSAWFTEEEGGGTGCPHEGPRCPRIASVGHIDASGAITEYPLPSGITPYGIAMGADGNLWMTGTRDGQASGWIGRMTPSGTVTSFPLRLHNQPFDIVAGPDGALWFTEDGTVFGGTGAIGRLTASGSLTEFVLPTSADHRSGAGDIAVGSDGNLWFTWISSEVGPGGAMNIGRITPSGTITRFPVLNDRAWAGGITAASDGNVWFTVYSGKANLIGRIIETGAITLFRMSGNASAADISSGPQGVIWFSDYEAMAIGRFNVRDTSDA